MGNKQSNQHASPSISPKKSKQQMLLQAKSVSKWTSPSAVVAGPLVVDLNGSIPAKASNYLSLGAPNTKQLLVTGQGTIELQANDPTHPSAKLKSFDMIAYNKAQGEKIHIRLSVNHKGASIEYSDDEKTTRILKSTTDKDSILQNGGQVHYWLSINHSISDETAFIKYGIGELRNKLTKLQCDFTVDDSKNDGPIPNLIRNADTVKLNIISGPNCKWRTHRDAVVSNPASAIIDPHTITMDHVDADHEEFTIIHNLSPACNQLYHNIYGEKFVLDTPSFPNFTQAIEESIADPKGWCYDKLQEKKGEFGGDDEVYLRITLGKNHCNSPGIPYVMEIWPPNCKSPIHNHGQAHAIIRVLHGTINVELYPFLAPHCDEPFETKVFKTGDITYMTEGINQTHRLINKDKNVTCITIQCYQYGFGDRKHYEFFDYIEGKDIKQFNPKSDKEFGEFKRIMQDEYKLRHIQAR